MHTMLCKITVTCLVIASMEAVLKILVPTLFLLLSSSLEIYCRHFFSVIPCVYSSEKYLSGVFQLMRIFYFPSCFSTGITSPVFLFVTWRALPVISKSKRPVLPCTPVVIKSIPCFLTKALFVSPYTPSAYSVCTLLPVTLSVAIVASVTYELSVVVAGSICMLVMIEDLPSSVFSVMLAL